MKRIFESFSSAASAVEELDAGRVKVAAGVVTAAAAAVAVAVMNGDLTPEEGRSLIEEISHAGLNILNAIKEAIDKIEDEPEGGEEGDGEGDPEAMLGDFLDFLV